VLVSLLRFRDSLPMNGFLGQEPSGAETAPGLPGNLVFFFFLSRVLNAHVFSFLLAFQPQDFPLCLLIGRMG